MLDGRWRTLGEPAVRPLGLALRRAGITADHLTLVGVVMAVATAVAIATGHLLLAFLLGWLAAVPDLLDGAVAKASNSASPRGAFFDSVADRLSDAVVLGGVAWHLTETRGGLIPMLPMAVMAMSMLISYERARAESLGYNARGGLMERAERVIALGVGLAFPVLLVPVLWLLLAGTSVTAVHRFVKVWRQASVPRRRGAERPVIAERWRAWRESAGVRARPARAEWRSPVTRRGRRDSHRRRAPSWRRR